MDELRHENAGVVRLDAHGELVAEVTRRGLAHARHAQVLAQHGGGLLIEFIHRHDAMNFARAGEIADAFQHVVAAMLVRHEIDFVNGLARPFGVAEFFECDENHMAAVALGLAQKGFAFEVSGDAEHVDLALIGHGARSFAVS